MSAAANSSVEPASEREFYRTRDVIGILGISRRQLQYWAQTGLVRPSVRTRGGHHRYAFQDLVALKAAKRLIDAGVSLQRIRKNVRALTQLLPRLRRPLAEVVLVATDDVVLVFHEGAAFEAVTGQEWILEVARLERDVEEWQRRRNPAAPSRSQRSGTLAPSAR